MTTLKRLWAGPLTLAGRLVALLGTEVWRGHNNARVYFVRYGSLLNWIMRRLNILGFTWGETIITRVDHYLYVSFEDHLQHEYQHTLQAYKWGPLLPFVYVILSIKVWLQGGKIYSDNPLEVEARKAEENENK